MRRSRRIRDDGSEPTFDSFLDIVANLVGILVILIMVIGVRAQEAWVHNGASTADPMSDIPVVPDVSSYQQRVEALTRELDLVKASQEQIDAQRSEEELAKTRLRQQLDEHQLRVEEHRNAIDVQTDETQQANQAIADLQSYLRTLELKTEELKSATPSTTVIQHFPTPIAKTVFGREVHFRLLDGRLVFVPLDQMTARLKREATHKIWKLKNTPQITESIGPENGFVLQYTLARRTGLAPSPNGVVMQQRVELVRFVMLATGSRIGEPIDVALQTNSEFHRRIAGLDPQNTTITVWTYPESFADFRRLKDHLRERGFLAAARPLPHGHPIGGSPQGSRSMAQ